MLKESFVAIVLSYVNYPSVKYSDPSKGNNMEGFGCSGFVNFLLRKANYPSVIPRHANEFFDRFGIFIDELARDMGDLVFFSKRGGVYPNHIGIMISRDEYIHSSSKNGRIICEKLVPEIIAPEKNTTQIYFSNPIGFKRITIPNGRYQQMFLS